jgi:hypothetical protein
VNAGKLEEVTPTHKEIFERYLHAGAISRDPDAQAAMFTEDGVYEAPLVPDGHRLPRHLAGRSAIRGGISAFHRETASMRSSTIRAGSANWYRSCRSSGSATGGSPCSASTSPRGLSGTDSSAG